MSNWFQNELKVLGSDAEVAKALKTILNELGEVDFTIISPIPQGENPDARVFEGLWSSRSNAFYTKKMDDNKYHFSTKGHAPAQWLAKLAGVLNGENIDVTVELTSAEGGQMVGAVHEANKYGEYSNGVMTQDEIREFLNIEEEIDETTQKLEKLVEDADHLYVLGAEVGYLHDILYEHYDESIRFAGKDSTDALVRNTTEPDGLTIEIEDHDWAIEVTSLNESISDNIPMTGLSDEKLVRLAELLTDLYELMIEHDINPEEAHDYQ